MKPEPTIVVLSAGDLNGDWQPDPVGNAINHLPERDAYVIRTAYLGADHQPDRVIADHLGIDRSRVTRIRNRALTTLRTELDG